jgi:hypothetical protein
MTRNKLQGKLVALSLAHDAPRGLLRPSALGIISDGPLFTLTAKPIFLEKTALLAR